MKRLFQVGVAGVILLLSSSVFAHVTIQKGPLLPNATSQLQSDFGRPDRDLDPTVLGVRLTNAGLNYIQSLINQVLQDSELREYVDCLVKGMLDADTADGTDEVEWNLDTDQCDDDATYDPGTLIDPTCLSIPIVGTFCLFLKIQDDPIDTDDFIIEYHVNTPTDGGDDFPRLSFFPNTNTNKILRSSGETDPSHDYDDSLDLRIYFADLTLDVLFTYPSTTTDEQNTGFLVQYDTCSSTLEGGPECLGTATCGETDLQDNYVMEEDLSNYPTMWANLVIGCYDGPAGPLDSAEQMA